MRLVATAVGGGVVALITLYLAKIIAGGLVGFAIVFLSFLFKLVLAILAVWLGVKLLKKLVPPAKQA